MLTKLMISVVVLAAMCYFTESLPNRGDKMRLMFPELFNKKEENERKTVIRRPRHHKWLLNEIEEGTHSHPPTTTVSTTTTKSPEQIKAELEAEMRRVNPKGFLAGKNLEKNKDKFKIFGTDAPVTSIDEQVDKMKEKLTKMQTSCVTNADCTNNTCCLINDKDVGSCILKPHKIDHSCSDMCPCTNNLECKTKIEETNEEELIKTPISQCAIKEDSKEYEQKLLEQLRNAVKKNKGCGDNCAAKRT